MASSNKPDSITSDPTEPIAAAFTPEGQELLAQLSPDQAATKKLATDLTLTLRKAGHSAELVAAVVHQLELRFKARGKFGPFAERMMLTQAGLEQATRLSVAARHAGRMRDAGVRHVADLGCGLGADAMAMAALGIDVTGVEADEVTAAAATVNTAPFPNVTVVHGLAEEVDISAADAVWMDPARRESTTSGTKRRWDPEAFSPPLSFVEQLADRGLPMGVKLGPGIPHESIPDTAEAQWVEQNGSVVEATLWFNAARRFNEARRAQVRRAALVIKDDQVAELTSSAAHPDQDPDALALGDDVPVLPHDSDLTNPATYATYLHEPAGAVIRAGLVADLAEQLDATGLDPHIAYLTGTTPSTTPLATSYRIDMVMPYKIKALRSWVRNNRIGQLTIKKRGLDVTPEELRKILLGKGHGDGTATLILTRIGKQRVVFGCGITPGSAV
ncbi:class I SAM-dependent methyltransferase [Pseudoglutamicibacter cumminsii]|uniref:class I SAM-dependent methyltransferase n=1 Tax=Pseudoglutamicibacter cumminsii TaxID=156979 RepID=UPI0021A55B87|nr:class I SAM-dependent methyltransferase [Pseudoglutamicibacter cumminsii]MCT1685746.1 class I SAM-dependent methyltransferase [Pseudoglutamicibacter cumminsii]